MWGQPLCWNVSLTFEQETVVWIETEIEVMTKSFLLHNYWKTQVSSMRFYSRALQTGKLHKHFLFISLTFCHRRFFPFFPIFYLYYHCHKKNEIKKISAINQCIWLRTTTTTKIMMFTKPQDKLKKITADISDGSNWVGITIEIWSYIFSYMLGFFPGIIRNKDSKDKHCWKNYIF